MRKLIGFIVVLLVSAIAAAQAQTELTSGDAPGSLLESTKQSLIYRMQSKIESNPVEREGTVTLYLSQRFPIAFATFFDLRETGSRCTVETESAPFEGSCRIAFCQQTTPPPVSAGRITIRGPGESLVLQPNPDNTYDTVDGDLVRWTGGEKLHITARGAPSGFDAFKYDFYVPTDATLTSSQSEGLIINRSQPLDFTWTTVESPRQARSIFTVVVGTFDNSAAVQCDYPLTKYEQGQIPATILSALPATPLGFLSFDVRQERGAFLNRGRDFVFTGVINAAVTTSDGIANFFVQIQ